MRDHNEKHPQAEPIVFAPAKEGEPGGMICCIKSDGKVEYGLVPCQSQKV